MLKEFKNTSPLYAEVLESVLSHAQNYRGTTRERIIAYLEEVGRHGCQSGMVSELIYYSDTVAFYDRHKYEINELIAETGLNVENLLGIHYDETDPLLLEQTNQNFLAWWAYETVCNELYNII